MVKQYNFINVDYVDRLVRRFGLQDTTQRVDPFYLPRIIQPTTDADELLRTPKVYSDTKDLTAAAGTYVPFLTITSGKRAIIRSIHRQGSTGGTEVRMAPKSTDTARPFSVFGTGGGAAGETYDGRLCRVNEGGSIGMLTSGNGADGAIRLTIFYDEEDAF